MRNIQTKSGERVAAGVAVVACGSEPNLEIVRNTPLSGPHGSPVTEYLETEALLKRWVAGREDRPLARIFGAATVPR